MNDFNFLVDRYLDFYPFFIPLGLIGIWRWSVWLTKRGVATFYHPQKGDYEKKVSVVTPVYNENPKTFERALESWEKNSPHEIIAVIDYTDKACIEVFKKFTKTSTSAKLIVTKKPGKRPALADGIRVAESPIVALVDSDTIWTKDVLKNALVPFKDGKIAGVATRQSVEDPKTLAQKLFSIRLEQRYWDEIPFLSTSEDVLVCLSGRTAFYRREILLPLLDEMVNETFMGEKVISGEDKSLTYLVQAAGWKTTYQSTAWVFTPGERSLSTFFKQQIRWTRNSWRAELGAIRQGWIFRHPIFTLYTFDRVIQPFTLLISPIYFAVSLFYGLWIPVFTILTWWFLTRGIKMYPHLKRKPTDIVVLPLFILFNFASAYIRIYSLFSLNRQGWLTRWDKARLPRYSFASVATAHVVTFLIAVGLTTSIVVHKQQTYFAHQLEREKLIARTLPTVSTNIVASSKTLNVLGATSVSADGLLAKKYNVKQGDSIASVAQKFGVNIENLRTANISRLTNWSKIDSGMILNIPPQGMKFKESASRFNFLRIYPDVLQIYYDQPSDTIVVSGRGKEVTLADLQNSVGKKYLAEVAPKIWYMNANLFIRSGVTLRLNKSEVTWLKMASNKNKFVTLRAVNGTILINGVKITSWDEKKNNVDKDYTDKRSFILVKDGSRMDVVDSEIAYLGFPRTPDLTVSPYGISWKMSNGKLGTTILTGEVLRSKFHHNYFGAYTFGATGMLWRGNEFYENVRYGLDPHDDSNGFLVEDNKFYNNGTHGLIFSKRCVNNVIRNNVSYNNKLHGIMLHELSSNNVIENNTVFGNLVGVALDNASQNIIRSNNIYANEQGIRAKRESKENIIEGNTIIANSQYGIYLYGKSDRNIARENTFSGNPSALYVKSSANEFSRNIVEKSQVGVYLLGKATDNKLSDNHIRNNRIYGVYTKISDGLRNLLGQNNQIERNKKDIFGMNFN